MSLSIENVPISFNGVSVSYTTKWFRVDGDGGANIYHDPCWQADTSAHTVDGKPVDALSIPYVVANPLVAAAVPGVVLGCRAQVTYRGKTVEAVVADIGPRKKIGEGSIKLAELLGMPKSPISGGEEGEPVTWVIYPGMPANLNGVQFKLKKLGS